MTKALYVIRNIERKVAHFPLSVLAGDLVALTFMLCILDGVHILKAHVHLTHILSRHSLLM
jgi:hypothetical protein